MVPGTSRVPFDEEERVGLSRGKNAGIRMARAPLLLFTDDDVVVPPGWIRSYAEFFSRHPLDTIVAGGPIIPVPAEDLGAWPSWLDNRALIDLRSGSWGGAGLQPPDYVFGANMAVPATVFSRLGVWNEDLGTRRRIDRRSKIRSCRTGSGRQGEAYGFAPTLRSGTGFLGPAPHRDPSSRTLSREVATTSGRTCARAPGISPLPPGSVSFADSPHWCGTFSRRVSSWHGSGLAAERLRWSGRDRRRGGPADPPRDAAAGAGPNTTLRQDRPSNVPRAQRSNQARPPDRWRAFRPITASTAASRPPAGACQCPQGWPHAPQHPERSVGVGRDQAHAPPPGERRPRANEGDGGEDLPKHEPSLATEARARNEPVDAESECGSPSSRTKGDLERGLPWKAQPIRQLHSRRDDEPKAGGQATSALTWSASRTVSIHRSGWSRSMA